MATFVWYFSPHYVYNMTDVSCSTIILAAQPSNNKKFSSQFYHLLVTVMSLLEKTCSDKLEACKQFCSTLCISENSSELLFDDEQMKTINNCKTFKELFSTQLRHHWSWIEYSLLESIIDLSGSQDAEDELTRYQNYMAANIGMEIVTEKYSIEKLPSNCIKLHLTLKKNYANFTAENYKEVKEFIFNTLDVRQYVAYPFIIFLFGSLHLEIYVPKRAAEYMIKMVKTKEKELKENLFVFIEVGGEVVMNVSQEQVVNIHKIEQAEFEMLNIPVWVVERESIQFQVVKIKIPYKTGSLITVEAQPRTGDVITVPVEDNQDGSYTVSFPANQTGEVKLSITINDVHIKGSPCSVQVVPQYSTLYKPNKIVNNGGRMGQPWGIAFGKDGVWAVTDYSNDCISKFDSKDQPVRKFGFYGTGNGQFKLPVGLAFDTNNHLFVVDGTNHRVQKFTINGDYLLQFGKQGKGNGELDCPLGIAVHNDRVFVADQYNHRISVFQCDGQFIHTIGSGQFSTPYDVAVTNNNLVLVTDYGHHCISIFTLDGNYVDKIGSYGSDRGQLSGPSSVTVDLCGFIMVTESLNHRVSIFDKDGVFIHCFGSHGSSAGQFSYPRGIACSPNGSVYVCDYDNKRIQIFSDY